MNTYKEDAAKILGAVRCLGFDDCAPPITFKGLVVGDIDPPLEINEDLKVYVNLHIDRRRFDLHFFKPDDVDSLIIRVILEFNDNWEIRLKKCTVEKNGKVFKHRVSRKAPFFQPEPWMVSWLFTKVENYEDQMRNYGLTPYETTEAS